MRAPVTKLRITGGRFRGRRIEVAAGSRPTSELVREAMFSQLTDHHSLRGGSVLDCFCASGALGIEALSRGASSCHFVDAEAGALRTVARNLSLLGLDCPLSRRALPRRRLPAEWPRAFDLILADPPYDTSQDLLGITLFLARHAAQGGALVLEHSRRHPQSDALLELAGERAQDENKAFREARVLQRAYGETLLTIWRFPTEREES